MKLMLAEVVPRFNLVEFLHLPPAVIELVQHLRCVLRVCKIGHEDEWLPAGSRAIDHTDSNGVEVAREISRWREGDDGVFRPAFNKALDQVKGSLGGHPDDKVDGPVQQLVKNEERWVAGVEQKDIPRFESGQHLEEFRPLRCVSGHDGDVVDYAADHVVEGGEERLGAMSTFGPAQGVPEFVASLGRVLGAINGEDAVSEPAQGGAVHLIKLIGDLVNERPDELRVYLLSGLAEGGPGDRLLSGKGDVMVATLIPESVKERHVAATSGIDNEVEEERDEKLGRERAASREVLHFFSESGRFNAGQEAREGSKILPDCARRGMGIAYRILCRSLRNLQFIVSSCEHRPTIDRCSYSITFADHGDVEIVYQVLRQNDKPDSRLA